MYESVYTNTVLYSGTSLLRAPMGQKKVSLYSEVSSFQRLRKWYIHLGWDKVSDLVEVSTFQGSGFHRQILLFV